MYTDSAFLKRTSEYMTMYFQTLGNHDFDNGIAGIVPLLERIKYPVVVANLDITEEPTLKVLFILPRGGI